MANLYVDTDKFAQSEGPPVVEAFHSALKDLLRRRLDECGGDWQALAFGRTCELVTKDDIVAIEASLLATGYRFTGSAMISIQERPEAYKPLPGMDIAESAYSFSHPDAQIAEADAAGREQRGQGDNVSKFAANTVGVARYVRSSDRVLRYLADGIPPGSIAIIDDSGGTLTAPILEHFVGVICAGGTVRSHLGILTREYGIPCVMNAKVDGIFEGDTVEIETTAAAKTAEAYQAGIEMTARIWKHVGGGKAE